MEQGFSNIGLLIAGTVVTGLLVGSVNLIDKGMFSQNRSQVHLEAMEVERALSELTDCEATIMGNSIPYTFLCSTPQFVSLKGLDEDDLAEDVTGPINADASSPLYGAGLLGSWAIKSTCDSSGLTVRAAKLNHTRDNFFNDPVTRKKINFDHAIARVNLKCADAIAETALSLGSTGTINRVTEKLELTSDGNNLTALATNERLNQVATHIFPIAGAALYNGSAAFQSGIKLAQYNFTAKGDVADIDVNMLLGGYQIDQVYYSVDLLLSSVYGTKQYNLFKSDPISADHSHTVGKRLMLATTKRRKYTISIVAKVDRSSSMTDSRARVDLYGYNMSMVTLAEYLAE